MSNWDSAPIAETAADRAAHQDQALREHAARVAKTSPYYADRIRGEITSVADLQAAVDPITKSDIIADAAAHPPYGTLLAAAPRDLLRLYVHPGPQVMAWTARDQDSVLDMYAAGIATTGFDETDLVDVTFQYAWVMAGTVWDLATQRVGAAVAPGGAGGTAEHLQNLKALNVTGLMGFPTYLEEIAARAAEHGIDPVADLAVRKLLVIGEMRGQGAKERIRDAFGADFAREAYGTAEAGLVAAECPSSEGGMHVHRDVVLEIRDPATGEPVAGGEGGELYLTPLGREAMPLLRYRTGDITEYLRAEPCACGRTSPRIGRILGRSGDLVRVKGVFLSPTVVRDIVTDGGRADRDYELVITRPERRDHLTLTVTDPGPDADGLARTLASRIKDRCRVTVEVTVVAPGGLPAGTGEVHDRRVDT